MNSICLKAPAKVNYLLDVIRKRPDNYHDLRMIMQRIAIYDEIVLSLSDMPGIRVICGKDGVPDGLGNIAWKAADTLLQRIVNKPGIDISITKNIPVAAGLGGGSSDAASVLMGLNDLLKIGLNDRELMDLGLNLGADVPFFIFKKTALAEGIGELLTPVEGLPSVWLVLVNPNIHVSTAWVYKSLKLTKEKDLDKLPKFSNRIEDICSLLSNDLENVTIGSYPLIKDIKRLLLEKGARGALMSGSGPTVFGVFESEEKARHCHSEFAGNTEWYTAVTHTI
ncbi:MAG: 4-(cytidine 5'-diphospho)-2-C-methyl-D-erythritol kinase [Geobacteraceae bacterium]|nr:4-(cytidine 5'-diphospho)-2-C-methyl-D-erythritol kinase [Geobacteraceae bacterium]